MGGGCRASICQLIDHLLRNHLLIEGVAAQDEDVIVQIVARSQEVDTGARNFENIVNRTLLPELAPECLSRMADADAIEKVHVGVEDSGMPLT